MVNISKLLTGIVDDFAPAAEDQGQILVAEIDKGLSISGDPELLTLKALRLLQVTEESLYRGIAAAQAGNRLGDISFAVRTAHKGRAPPNR